MDVPVLKNSASARIGMDRVGEGVPVGRSISRAASAAETVVNRQTRPDDQLYSLDLNRIGRRTINVHAADRGVGAGWNLLGHPMRR
jgi:hypothetical protein